MANTTITAASISKVSNKKGQTLGYLVPSDHEAGCFYQVTYNRNLIQWECTCKDSVTRNRQCKHCRAVIEVIRCQREERVARDIEVAAMHAQDRSQREAETLRARREAAPINSRNAGFSLLK